MKLSRSMRHLQGNVRHSHCRCLCLVFQSSSVINLHIGLTRYLSWGAPSILCHSSLRPGSRSSGTNSVLSFFATLRIRLFPSVFNFPNGFFTSFRMTNQGFIMLFVHDP